MKNKSSSRALCGHLKATLSGFIPDDELQAFVGFLDSLEDSTFEKVASEIATVFSYALVGRFNVGPNACPHLNRRTNGRDADSSRDEYGGGFSILNRILDLDPSLAVTQTIWAGMTNLKSCLFRLDSDISVQDLRKGYQSITHTTSLDEKVVHDWKLFINEYVPFMLQNREIPEKEYLPVWAISASDKRMAYITEAGKCISLPRTDDRLYNITNSLRIPAIRELAVGNPSEFLTRVLYGSPVEAEWDLERFPSAFETVVPIGKIGISPKNGSKPRIVAVQLPVLGSLSYPLMVTLKKINDGTAIQWVKSHDGAREDLYKVVSRNVRKKNPDMIYSYDQSSFTDNFPYWEIQRPVLCKLRDLGFVSDYDIQIMDVVSLGAYDLSVMRKGYVSSYGTGTPMGSFPSFPLASMAHGIATAYCFYQAHGRFPSNSERYAWIVGDDAVIVGSPVAEVYEHFCETIGLTINQSKSLSSPRCVEFCSTFITPEGIFKKKKLPELVKLGSLVESIRYYGLERFVQHFPIYRDLSMDIAKIPEPFGLGKPVDELQPTSLGHISSVIQAKLRAGALRDMKDDVSVARDIFHGFGRSGFLNPEQDASLRPIPFHECKFVDKAYEPSTEPYLTVFELSMLEELDGLIQTVNSALMQSENAQNACERIGQMYQYFLSRYPNDLRCRASNNPGRQARVLRIAPDKGARPRTSELQLLVDLLRVSQSSDYENQDLGGGGIER